MKKILFLCGKNKLRSPTAEVIFSEVDGWEVCSAGINHDAVDCVSVEDIEWADYIFVMEQTHQKKLRSKYGQYLRDQKVILLGIPDSYGYMDEKLIEILQTKVPRLVN